MAQIEGVELIVCRMTLDMMELDESELLAGTISGRSRNSQIRQGMQDLHITLNC